MKPSPPSHRSPGVASALSKRCSVAGVLGSALLLAMLLIMGRKGDQNQAAHASSTKTVQPVSTSSQSNASGEEPSISLKPSRITLGDREVIFQFPPGSCSDSLKGIIFLYHGCTRTAMSFFYSPQGRDMMQHSLSAGLAVVAFEKERPQGCWSKSSDLDGTIDIGNQWVKQHLGPHCGDDAAGRVPFFGFGASSGGSFVAKVASASTGFKFAAINVQIMTPRADITTPTVFTVMSRDEHTMQGVEQVSSELKEKNIPTLVLKTKPKRVTAEYFLDRFKEDKHMTKDIAESICADLQGIGALADDGELIEDPRSVNLEPYFDKYKSPVGAFGVSTFLWDMLSSSEKEDASSLWLVEETNVCYDQHELTKEKWSEVLDFFFANAPRNSGGAIK